MPKFAVILAAAGRSTRFGNEDLKKPFVRLAGKAVWLHSAERFLARDDVAQVIVVIAPEDEEIFKQKFGANLAFLGVEVAHGGQYRSQSIANGLRQVRDDIDYVAVHDAARPCVSERQISDAFTAVEQTGAALLAAPVTATLKRADDHLHVLQTVDRSNLWEAQTPQVFRYDFLDRALGMADEAAPPTDDAQLVEELGEPVKLVESSQLNIKITHQKDLALAEQILKILPKPKPAGGQNPFADDDTWR